MAAQEGATSSKSRAARGNPAGRRAGREAGQRSSSSARAWSVRRRRHGGRYGRRRPICDVSLRRLTYLADVMPRNVKTLMSSEYNIREELKHADLVVGSVLIPGAKAPKLVTRDMLKLMEPGTVMVDVAIDQGGCFETSRPTTHEDPGLLCRRHPALLRGQHPRCGALYVDARADQRHAALCLQLADRGWRRACPRTKSCGSV